MTMKRLVAHIVLVLALMFGANVAHAQDSSDEPALQIDLEALEGLNPARAAPAEDETQEAPLLPGEEAPVSAPVETNTFKLEQAPQDPNAPRPDVVSTAPAAKRTAASLKDLIIPVLFEPGVDQLNLAGAEILDDVIKRIEFKGVRLQLSAYAGDVDNSESAMRRLSLKRAISIRAYLMSRGIEGTRIDVRPKGMAPDSPRERVDIIFLPQ